MMWRGVGVQEQDVETVRREVGMQGEYLEAVGLYGEYFEVLGVHVAETVLEAPVEATEAHVEVFVEAEEALGAAEEASVEGAAAEASVEVNFFFCNLFFTPSISSDEIA